MGPRVSVPLAASLVATSLVPLLGQAQPAQKPVAFEVASVKPNTSVDVPPNFQLQPGGRILITNLPLFQLIRIAYASDAIQLDAQVVSPAWTKSERFDIVAKAEG